MKKHGYDATSLSTIRAEQIGGLIFAIFSTGLACAILLSAILMGPSRWGVGCFSVLFITFGWTIGSFFVNLYPTIWVDEEGLVISAFIISRIRIPWSEVLRVDRDHTYRVHLLVTARRITPFHRLYGWFYLHTFNPLFVIRRDIYNFDELIQEIKRRVPFDRII